MNDRRSIGVMLVTGKVWRRLAGPAASSLAPSNTSWAWRISHGKAMQDGNGVPYRRFTRLKETEKKSTSNTLKRFGQNKIKLRSISRLQRALLSIALTPSA